MQYTICSIVIERTAPWILSVWLNYVFFWQSSNAVAFYIKDVIRSAATFPVFTWVVIEMRNSGYTNNFLKSFLKPLVILLPLFINLSSPSQARNENLAKHTAALQNSLNFFGFEAGEPDGILGKKTQAAISLMHECLYQKASVALSKSSQDFLIESFEIAKAQQLKGSCSLLKNFTSSAFQCSKPTWRLLLSCIQTRYWPQFWL